MATVTIYVTHNGDPVAGAEVIDGITGRHGTTSSGGTITKTVNGTFIRATNIIVRRAATGTAGAFQAGFACAIIEAGSTLALDV